MLDATQSRTLLPGVVPIPRKVRCLLLDDSNFDRARIRRLSQKTNFSIELDEVESIAQLDAAVNCENYDLVMIDYRLPVGDGMVALDHLMRSGQNRDVGKIMITGDGARQTVLQAMRAGCHDFLSKEEMSVEVLQAAMLNALSAARQRQLSVDQALYNQEVFRKGLISAIQDREVQSNVMSFLRSRADAQDIAIDHDALDPVDLDALFISLDNSEERLLH